MLVERRRLSPAELDAVAGLERRVVNADGGRLKLEWGVLRHREGDLSEDLLWWEGDRLVGFCGLYGFGTPLELAGMVDPDFRRRGIGSELLGRALELAHGRGNERVLLVTPRSSAAGLGFALAWNGKLDHSEHFLVLTETPALPAGRPDVVVRRAAEADVPELVRILAAAFGTDDAADAAGLVGSDEWTIQMAVESGGAIVGGLRVSRAEGAAGIYGFAIDPALQGRGIGRAALAQVCAELRQSDVAEVTIEVEVDNDHALGLYTSLGFELRATEDYYALRSRRIRSR